ncbi:MAG TPA: AAA family ATPase, partial [Gaiellaceae bacterium]|nr:AAA family ATPase [Gaiellaceae bacterium]
MQAEEFGERCDLILSEVERAVVGKREALELVLLGLLADGHVLIEDYPGLAKTLIARSFAQVASMDFARIQFTPDLMPSDVTGASIFDQRTTEFEFRPGPIFTNLLLADEINRAPPKTQAALLEAMQERQVTSEGVTRPLERPFLVLATQNPIEYEGTYPLPEAQLDRFLLRVGVGYPSRDDEWRVLADRIERQKDDVELETIVDAPTLVEMQAAIEHEGTYPLPEAQVDRFLAKLKMGYPAADAEKAMIRRYAGQGASPAQEVRRILEPATILRLQELADQVHVAEDLVDYVLGLA